MKKQKKTSQVEGQGSTSKPSLPGACPVELALILQLKLPSQARSRFGGGGGGLGGPKTPSIGTNFMGSIGYTV